MQVLAGLNVSETSVLCTLRRTQDVLDADVRPLYEMEQSILGFAVRNQNVNPSAFQHSLDFFHRYRNIQEG
jgi:hypothetical protein